MPAVRVNRLTRAGWRIHRRIYGRFGLGTKIGSLRVLLLTTTGRRSGKARTVALSFVDAAEGPVVIGSYAGEPRDPAWAHNLRVQPEVTVQIGRDLWHGRSRELQGAERDSAARLFEAADPAYRVYQHRTSRRLPVFVLERTDRPSLP